MSACTTPLLQNHSLDSYKQVEIGKMQHGAHLWVHVFAGIQFWVSVLRSLPEAGGCCVWNINARVFPASVSRPIDRSIYFLINWQSLEHAWLSTFKANVRMHYEYVLQWATPHKPLVTARTGAHSREVQHWSVSMWRHSPTAADWWAATHTHTHIPADKTTSGSKSWLPERQRNHTGLKVEAAINFTNTTTCAVYLSVGGGRLPGETRQWCTHQVDVQKYRK